MHVPLSPSRSLLVVGAVMCAAASVAVGQCANAWRPGEGIPGADGDVLAAVTWDPDGGGPLGEHVVLGGKFRAIGSVMVEHVALWDPATGVCTPLGAGLDGNVTSLFVRPSGELVAGGAFTTSSGGQCARWTGTAWVPLGSGPTGAVTAFATMPNGDLAAACSSSLGVATWNGVSWASLGPSPLLGARSLLTLANGTLLAGGYFPQTFPAVDAGIMAWNGSSWASFADIGWGGVRDMEQRPNGDVIAAGDFDSLGGVASGGLARWNGTTWSNIGGTTGYFYSLAALPNGDLLAGGFHFGGGGGLRQWNGTTWSLPSAGMVPQYVYAIAVLANGDSVIGGYMTGIGTQAQARNVARSTASGWVSIVPGSVVYAISNLAPQPNGDLIAGGNFFFPGIGIRQLARRSAGVWSPLGYAGIGNAMLLVRADGTMIVGVSGSLVRWDGTAWAPFGPGVGAVNTLFELPSGDIVVGGNFQLTGVGPATVARWDGSTWHALGSYFGTAKALALLPNGDLVAAGAFLSGVAQHELARWNGSQWSTWDLAPGLVYMESLLVLADGSIVVGTGGVQGGSSDGTVARWDGTAWATLGGSFDAPVRRIVQLPDGDLVVGGFFNQVGGVAHRGLARWDGAAWQACGDALNGGVTTIALTANGDLVVGGAFTIAGGAPSSGLAVLTTTCPATTVVAGAGCAGASVTASLPWTGSTWRAYGSGLPNAALVFVVQGFATTSLPLASVFATALPGCTLHVQPDYVGLVLANAGNAAVGFAVPNDVALAGTTFHHQMVPLALDATLAVTATNALTLTVGTF